MNCFEKNTKGSRVRLLVRIILDVLVLIIALSGPWWLALSFAVFLLFFLGTYEVVLVGLLIDSMYTGGATQSIWGAYKYTAILFVLISVSCFFSPFMRGRNRSSATY
jgi:hypothetical protein